MLSMLATPSLPSSCEICARWPAASICTDCRTAHARLVSRCTSCALSVATGLDRCLACRTSARPLLDRVWARVDYHYPWADLVADYKFKGNMGLASHMADLMLESEEAQRLLGSCDVLIPIPLAPSRFRERGFNQALALTQQLKKQSGCAAVIDPHVLKRLETRVQQHTLDRTHRHEHAQRAMQVSPGHASRVAGRRVLLIDDIMTTGATLEAAGKVLHKFGTQKVSAMVFARTPAPDPDDME